MDRQTLSPRERRQEEPPTPTLELLEWKIINSKACLILYRHGKATHWRSFKTDKDANVETKPCGALVEK